MPEILAFLFGGLVDSLLVAIRFLFAAARQVFNGKLVNCLHSGLGFHGVGLRAEVIEHVLQRCRGHALVVADFQVAPHVILKLRHVFLYAFLLLAKRLHFAYHTPLFALLVRLEIDQLLTLIWNVSFYLQPLCFEIGHRYCYAPPLFLEPGQAI